MEIQQKQIEIEISKILLCNTRQVFFVSLVTPILFTLSLEIFFNKFALIWMAFTIICTFFRFFMLKSIKFGSQFLLAFRFSLLVVCLSWGIGALNFSQYFPSKEILILLFLIGFCGAALPTIAACKYSVKIMVFCILAPILVKMVFLIDSVMLPAFCAIIFFFIISIQSGAKISKDIHSKIATQLHLEEQVKYNKIIAMTDDLTKVSNRRFFNLEMNKISKEKINSLISVLILDIDHFKIINDQFGHDAGDVILAKTAEIISCILPKFSCFARIGGEEFGIITKNMSYSEVQNLSEEILCKISSNKFYFDSNSPPIYLTLSIGISMTHISANIYKAHKFADMALYEAKKQGRNRAIFGDLNYL